MRRKNLLIVIILLFLLAAVGLFLKKSPSPPKETVLFNSAAPTHSNPALFYPLPEYAKRLTVRWYGKLVQAADNKTLACGKEFTGFHNGDDLEIFESEINKDVPVYAVADGVVRLVGKINGYGGLIVVEHNINNEVFTANYGHVNISGAQVKKGDLVKAGQEIALLGKACSPETDFERKHLHFAVHRGNAIDVLGYLNSQAELKDWINPSEFLNGLSATEPK